MKKTLWRKTVGIVASKLGEIDPEWHVVGKAVMRRSGPWVQVVSIDPASGTDEFVAATGLTYLRARLPFPDTLSEFGGHRLVSGPHAADAWMGFRRLDEDPNSLLMLLREQAVPPIDRPLDESEAERAAIDRQGGWAGVYLRCILAAERGDWSGAETQLDELERLATDRPLDVILAEARRVIGLMDNEARLREHLEEVASERSIAIGI